MAAETLTLNLMINISLTLAGLVLFVLPGIYHLVSDALSGRSRGFSYIPHRQRQTFATIVRLATIFTAAVLSYSIGRCAEWIEAGLATTAILFLHACALGYCGFFVWLSETDRRLTIDPETGLITWRKFTWPSRLHAERVAYIDEVYPISYRDGRFLDLLGLDRLRRYRASSRGGKFKTSGHYTRTTLVHTRDAVNAYLKAFFRHDDPGARKARARFKQIHERRRR